MNFCCHKITVLLPNKLLLISGTKSFKIVLKKDAKKCFAYQILVDFQSRQHSKSIVLLKISSNFSKFPLKTAYIF